MKKHTAIVVGGLMAVGGTIAVIDSVAKPDGVVLDTAVATEIQWNKPTTDAAWADDVKKENFDIKSDKVLQQMVTSHIEKLLEEQKAFQKYQDCLQCINYDYYQQFLTNGFSDTDAHTEADKQTQVDYAQRLREIEKIEQSIERMNHELDLRSKGYVVPSTASKTMINSVDVTRIRKIND